MGVNNKAFPDFSEVIFPELSPAENRANILILNDVTSNVRSY